MPSQILKLTCVQYQNYNWYPVVECPKWIDLGKFFKIINFQRAHNKFKRFKKSILRKTNPLRVVSDFFKKNHSDKKISLTQGKQL